MSDLTPCPMCGAPEGRHGYEPEACIRELEAWRRMAEVNLDAADRHLAELVRYREALERIVAHDYSFNEYEQIARQALTGGDE